MNLKNLLITGGTGSFGQAFILHALNSKIKFNKIIIFSRDEYKQSILKTKLSKYENFYKLRFFLGDVRDKDRLTIALKNVNYIIHAAAIKQVDSAEYNPIEYIKTNIIGAQNIIEASIVNNIEKVIALSTDKASSPINLYGATKLCSDKLFVAANNYAGKNIFSVVRYGNVFGSRGSVVELFRARENKKIIYVTHKEMTRFNISLKESIELVLWSLKNSLGSEIFVPKIKSYRVIDLVKAFSEKAKIKIIGIRPGEKIHEEMISRNESRFAFDIGKYYAILSNADTYIYSFYKNNKKYKKIKENFSYESNINSFLSVEELKKLINEK
jgi:UDP-N-acetylglucosamine 4,6-dehydratase (inverting)